MDIKAIIKQNIQEIEAQLNVNLTDKYLKPIVFIDNTNFGCDENPLAIVHLDLFNAKDVVSLKGKLNTDDAFSITNLVGEETVYCLWGNDNIKTIQMKLEEWGYPLTKKSKFFDLKEAANKFYGKEINNFEDIQNIISYSTESIDLIFSSKESVMYSLFIDMINNEYNNEELVNTIENLILENELANADNIYKGREFRAAKSNIELEQDELANLEMFVDYMSKYNVELCEYLQTRVNNTEMNEVHRMLLTEKATMCRFKNDVYKYTKALLQAYKNEDFETYKFYYKTLDMYTMIEDAFILSESLKDEDTSFSRFVSDLGGAFAMSTATYAQTYMLRKNVMAKLYK